MMCTLLIESNLDNPDGARWHSEGRINWLTTPFNVQGALQDREAKLYICVGCSSMLRKQENRGHSKVE